MSIGGNQQLARDVVSAIEDWTPSEAYGHESKFQNELQEYLDKRLNSGGDMMLGASDDVVVEREHGNVNGDVVVNGEIGIEMKRDLTNSQTKKLRGQIEEYQKEYSHVIPVACGIDDMDGWRKLKNDYENQTGIGVRPDSAPVRFIHKERAGYGNGDGAENYARCGGGGQQGAELDEVANLLGDGVKGYRSLTGDGPMESGEAVSSLAQAVLIVVFFIVVVGIVLLNIL
jgi:hypothetical protein